MGDNHVDTIEFRAVSPKTKLTGLDDAHKKLVAMNVALEAINRQLAGLSTHSSFTRTTAGIADTIKQMEKVSGKGIGRALSKGRVNCRLRGNSMI